MNFVTNLSTNCMYFLSTSTLTLYIAKLSLIVAALVHLSISRHMHFCSENRITIADDGRPGILQLEVKRL